MRKVLTRKQYIIRNCTHREYFGQFVTSAIKRLVCNRFGSYYLQEAFKQDESFNTIPLTEWDDLGSILRRSPTYVDAELLAQAGEQVSLSTYVCILKEAARQIIEEDTREKL